MGAGLREQPRGRHLLVGSLRRAAAAAGGPPSPRGVGGREGAWGAPSAMTLHRVSNVCAVDSPCPARLLR